MKRTINWSKAMKKADINGVTASQLKSFIERIERLEEEKAGISADIKEIFAEAKGTGYDTKALREVLKLRREDKRQRAELEALVELYCSALGMSAPSSLAEEAA
jgi:uncharacterized protein (UPF0335 family)